MSSLYFYKNYFCVAQQWPSKIATDIYKNIHESVGTITKFTKRIRFGSKTF
jgi:hypothetical protein